MTDQPDRVECDQLRLLIAAGVHGVLDKLPIKWLNNEMRIAYLEQVLAHLIAYLDHLRNANGKEE